MTLQEMHEAVMAKRNALHVMFRLFKNSDGIWRAGWSHSPYASGNTAQEAIDSAFRLAMES